MVFKAFTLDDYEVLPVYYNPLSKYEEQSVKINSKDLVKFHYTKYDI